MVVGELVVMDWWNGEGVSAGSGNEEVESVGGGGLSLPPWLGGQSLPPAKVTAVESQEASCSCLAHSDRKKGARPKGRREGEERRVSFWRRQAGPRE